MQASFLSHLYQLHASSSPVPSPESIGAWVDGLLALLFPELAREQFRSQRAFEHAFAASRQQLFNILEVITDDLPERPALVEEAYVATLPQVHQHLEADAQAIFSGDPAANSLREVIRTYPGFYAIAVYRLAHEFCRLGVPLIPRILSEHAHQQTGIEIHPSAKIGERFCIDHGTGIVIGETVSIANDVKLYQGVTLGALSVQKEFAKTKRHPTIEQGVVIYANATILGGETVIGADSIIGGNTWITKSVSPGSRVYYSGGGTNGSR